MPEHSDEQVQDDQGESAEVSPAEDRAERRETPAAAQIRAMISPAGLVSTGITAVIAFGLALLAAALLVMAASLAGATLTPVEGLVAALVGAGWMLGSGISSGVVSSELFGALPTAAASITIVALGLLAAVFTAIALVARLRARVDATSGGTPGAVCARAAIEAVTISLVLTAVTSIPALSLGRVGVGVNIRSDGLSAFLITSILIFAALTVGRLNALGWRLPALAGFGSALRESAIAAAWFGGVFSVAALLLSVIFAIQNENLGPVLAVIPFLLNAAGLLAVLASFGGISAGSSFGGAQTVFAGSIGDGWGLLLPILGLLTLLIVAVFVGARRGATTAVRWNRVWQLPLAAFVFWLLLVAILGGRADGTLLVMSGGVSLFPVWWMPLLGAFWAAVLSIVAELAPRIVASIAPRVFARLVGRSGVAAWNGSASDGAVAAEMSGAEIPSAPAAAAPLSAQTKKRIVVGAASLGGATFVVIAAFAGVGVINATRGPEAVVSSYLSALAAGDAATAASIADPAVPNGDRFLLTNEALKAADHRLEIVSVKSGSTYGDSASVEAVVAIDGEHATHRFELERGANEMLVLDTWKLTAPMLMEVRVEAVAPGTENVLLGDIEVPLTESGYAGGSTRAVWMYPGVYTFSAPETKYVESIPATVRVLPSEFTYPGAAAVVEQTPTAALEQFVLERAQERVSACATVPTNVDEVCPYGVTRTDLASLSLKTQVDTVDELTLTSFRTGQAAITTQRQPFFGVTPDPRDVEFSLYGDIVFVDGEPEIEFTRAW